MFTTEINFNSNELIKAFFYTDPLSAFFANECGFEIISPSGEVVVFGGDNPILNPIRFSPFMYSGMGQCLETCIPMVFGCTDETACNFDPEANTLSSCTYNIEYYDCNNQCNADSDGDGVCDELEVVGCQDPLQYNFDPAATDAGECEPFVYGCTDNTMFNYNAEANSDNGSCEPFVYGCTDTTAFNYNPTANAEYDPSNCEPFIYGCTDPSMLNYNSEANTEDFSCISYIYGCTDSNAFNYDPLANTDNGSCIETVEGCADPEAVNYEATVNIPNNESCLYDAGCIGEPGVPYWLNDSCYAWIIDIDPYCCEVEWDGACIELYDYCDAGWPTGVYDIHDVYNVYPNPVTDVLNIQTSFNVFTEIYNASGQLVVVGTKEKRIDLKHLPKGLYHVIITYEGRLITKKITKL